MKKSPLVSVCLPNLNNRPFLEERIQCILQQTYTNWELVIVDNYSDDGAWEYFQSLDDPRIRIQQASKEGMYANWNNCIRLAKGDYIYIATSDDTMTPDCIEKLTQALEKHPQCDIAHSNLTVIDERGKEIEGFYLNKCRSPRYFKELIHQPHIRHAPHDGLLHYYGGTVYVSITQLLIRKSLFNRVGFFSNDFGSAADFEWEMRASLVANTVHVPEFLGTWRVHTDQATSFASVETPESYRKHLVMTRTARRKIEQKGFSKVVSNASTWEIPLFVQIMSLDLARAGNSALKLFRLLKWSVRSPKALGVYLNLKRNQTKLDTVEYIRSKIDALNLPNSIERI